MSFMQQRVRFSEDEIMEVYTQMGLESDDSRKAFSFSNLVDPDASAEDAQGFSVAERDLEPTLTSPTGVE